MGDVKPVALNVLSTVWGRLKGKGGSTFGRLTTNLFAEPPTVVAYDEMAEKKATAYGVKVKGILAFAPDWEYDGQDGMATAKDYELVPTNGWTPSQQIQYSAHSTARRLMTASICAPRARPTRSM